MGTVIVSADAELGWGFYDLQDRPEVRLANARTGWRRLSELCEQYQIPATWAVVGHLFCDDCDGRHADHPTPEGWFDHERGPDAMPRSLRFADGLVDDIVESTVDHDIGLHTFSHVLFDDPMTTRKVARAEVGRALDAARARGLNPTSFVFPRNRIGHREVLASYDIESYRGTGPRIRGPTRRLRKLAVATVARSDPRLVTPYVDDAGLVNVPASLFLFSFEGAARATVEPVFGDPVLRHAKRGIDAAAAADGVFHMWLHPNNIVTGRDAHRIDRIFEYLDRRRNDSAVRVRTMDEVAAETRAEHKKAELSSD